MPVLKRKNSNPQRILPENSGFGAFREAKQLLQFGVMMYTEGEPRDKQARMASPPAQERDYSPHDSNDIATSRYNGQGIPHMNNMQYVNASKKDDYFSSSSPGSPGDKGYIPSRKQREFIPEGRKDDSYWEKRRKNNEAARRSREKRRMHDFALENKICDLNDENRLLRKELIALKKKFGVPLDKCFALSDDEQTDTSTTTAAQSGFGHLNRPGGSGTTKPHLSHAETLSQATVYTSPPPLLAVAGAVPMSVPVQGIPYTNGAAFPYYLMPSQDGSNRMNQNLSAYRGKSDTPRANSEPQDSSPLPATSVAQRPTGNQSAFPPVVVKSEPSEDGQRSGNSCLNRLSAPGSSMSPELLDRGEYHHLRDNQDSESAWLDSNSNSYTSDDQMDEPLQLTVNTGDKESLSSQLHYAMERRDSRSPPTTLPLKLRHKEFYAPPGHSSSYPTHPYMDGLAQLSEIALAQANPLPLVKKSRDYSSRMPRRLTESSLDPKFLDPKYLERRRRNNEAARKCRENRKALTRLREAKSDYLEGENNKLRNEMDGLSEEVKQLRDLIEKKQLEQEIEAHQKTKSHSTDTPDTSSGS